MVLEKKRYVHAPVVSGFCLFCHSPHGSKYPWLLNAEPREMCLYCHNPADVFRNAAHKDQEATCTDCHNPHADDRYFLKSGPAAPRALMNRTGPVIVRERAPCAGAGALAILAGLLALPAPVRCQVEDFRPRFSGFEGSLSVSGLYEDISHTSSTREHGTSDTLFIEMLDLGTSGWIYHPRLLLYRAKIGLGLAHEEVNGNVNAADAGRMQTAVLEEYELRTVLLPEHPYNLELFTVRTNPYLRGYTRLGAEYAGTATGGSFRWRQRPYAFHLSYQENVTDASSHTRTTDTLSSNAVYFLDWTTFAGGYTHIVSDSTFAHAGSRYTSDEYSGENSLRFFDNRLSLTSILGRIDFRQASNGAVVDDTRSSWSERLSLVLPFNLTAGLNYDHLRESSVRRDGVDTVPEKRTSTSETSSLTVQHRLYQSLLTNYTLSLLSSDTSTGSSSGVSHALNSTYLKRIPRGHVTAGVTFGNSSIDQRGALAVVNEPQQAPLFGEITLQRTDVALDSIAVRVKSATTGAWFDLSRGVHYTVFTVANTARILIASLPAVVLSSDPGHSYSFIVSYALLSITTTFDTTSWGGNLGLDLFDHLVSPYASYLSTSQSTAAEVLDTITTAAGLRLEWLPFSFLLERQHVSSDINPSTLTRAQLICRTTLSLTTQLLGEAVATSTNHETSLYQSQPFSEEYTGVTLHLQRRFPRQNLSLVGGGAWNRTQGRSDHETWSFDSVLTWRVGLLEIMASVRLSTAAISRPGVNEDAVRQFYMITIKRDLF